MKTYRSLWKYWTTNYMIFVVWFATIFFAIVSYIEEVYIVSGYMIFVFLLSVLASYIDWKRRG